MNLGLLCRLNWDFVFPREGPTSGFLGSLVDVGTRGMRMVRGCLRWCEKREESKKKVVVWNKQAVVFVCIHQLDCVLV